MNASSRILLVRHAAFGDCLLITPFIRHLRTQDCSAKIDVLSFFDFFSHYPEVNQWIDARKVAFRQIASRYDKIYVFSYEQSPTAHILDGFEFSSQLQLKNDAPFVPDISIEQASSVLRQFNLQAGKYIVFAPFAGPHSRDLGESKIGEIKDALVPAFPNHRIVIFHNKISLFKGVVNITGKRSFSELVTLMKNSAACLTVDTGFFHLAQACGTATVVIAGSTDPALRISRPELTQIVKAPIRCLGCYHRHIGTFGTSFVTCFRADWACKSLFSTQECIDKLRAAIEGRKFPVAKTMRRNRKQRDAIQKMTAYGDLALPNVQSYYLNMIDRERIRLNSAWGKLRRWVVGFLKSIKTLARYVQPPFG